MLAEIVVEVVVGFDFFARALPGVFVVALKPAEEPGRAVFADVQQRGRLVVFGVERERDQHLVIDAMDHLVRLAPGSA